MQKLAASCRSDSPAAPAPDSGSDSDTESADTQLLCRPTEVTTSDRVSRTAEPLRVPLTGPGRAPGPRPGPGPTIMVQVAAGRLPLTGQA